MCDTEDVIGEDLQPLNVEEQTIIAGVNVDDLDKLPHRIELAKHAYDEYSYEADLANGSHGTIHNIILDAREEIDEVKANTDGYVKLHYPPAAIILKPYHHSFPKFENLDEGLIPIFPQSANFKITTLANKNTKVHHRQYPLTPAYTFTDYKSQGQTLEHIIIDIRVVLGNFQITPFGVYMALSRSRGRDTIRLLGDFKEEMFTTQAPIGRS